MEFNRYAAWMAVWEFFQGIYVDKPTPRETWDGLYGLLDELWQDERGRNATPEELAAHAGALKKLRELPQ